MNYLGIEIGGTKLQLGIGADDGVLKSLWRGPVDPAAGPDGIRRQIQAAIPELLAQAGMNRQQLAGAGIGFGGPVDDATRTIIKSHQIAGWDDFPLTQWIEDIAGLPAMLGNDADVAGLAEARHGAGQGLSPIFYITVGSGIGGGIIINGEIYRGVGRGAAEIGHMQLLHFAWNDEDGEFAIEKDIVEHVASGWGIEKRAREYCRRLGAYHDAVPELVDARALLALAGGKREGLTTRIIAQAAEQGNQAAKALIDSAVQYLGHAIRQVITLLCPRRIVIGGGVSLIGESLFFQPLRETIAEDGFKPFAGLTDIVPAALGEEVVVHGAIALARQQLAKEKRT